jgi:lipoyl(octanoyl) transferase
LGILGLMKAICQVHWLGSQPYQAAWDLQNRLAAEIASGERPPTLLLLEHPHTYTFGRRGQPENLLWDEAERARRGVTLFWVDRGGDVTYHGPGQLVGYPLLPLAPLQAVAQEAGPPRLPQQDYVGYLRRLEQVLIQTLATFGVTAVQIPGLTGVWVTIPGETLDKIPAETQDPALAKIAAIGVKVDARGVTRHGFALNINTDPAYWQGIIGCGLVGHATANLADVLQPQPDTNELRQALTDAFGRVFGYQMVWAALTS